MPLEPAPLQTSAAFTPVIFEPADRPTLPMLIPPSPRPAQVYVRGSGTPILDEVSGDPLRKYLVEADAQRQLQHRIEGQIEDRLRELRVDAQVEGEAFSAASASDLRQFIQSVGVTKGPAIFLLDNGNIRALWRSLDGQQVGLQFLGGRRTQFVIFAWRENPRMMTRVTGIDSIVQTRARIVRDRVDHLLVG
jgi:hypothetical protein